MQNFGHGAPLPAEGPDLFKQGGGGTARLGKGRYVEEFDPDGHYIDRNWQQEKIHETIVTQEAEEAELAMREHLTLACNYLQDVLPCEDEN